MKLTSLTKEAIDIMKNMYLLEQPIDDFYYYIYNHPEAPYKDAYLNQEIICLMSGGMDSYIGYFLAKQKYPNTKALYIDYGYGYSEVEKETIKALNIDCLYVDISKDIKEYQKQGEQYWGEIFPGRNWIICTIAGSFIKNRGEIWLMAVDGEIKEKWGDKSKLFLNEGSKKLSTFYNKHIDIVAPFSHMTKGLLVKYFLSSGGDINKLKKTISCHFIKNINDKPCGKCMGCCHRYIGMKFNDIDEQYNSNIFENTKKLYYPMINDVFSGFSTQRINEIKTVLQL